MPSSRQTPSNKANSPSGQTTSAPVAPPPILRIFVLLSGRSGGSDCPGYHLLPQTGAIPPAHPLRPGDVRLRQSPVRLPSGRLCRRPGLCPGCLTPPADCHHGTPATVGFLCPAPLALLFFRTASFPIPTNPLNHRRQPDPGCSAIRPSRLCFLGHRPAGAGDHPAGGAAVVGGGHRSSRSRTEGCVSMLEGASRPRLGFPRTRRWGARPAASRLGHRE